jgi:hypothetical protein
VTHVLVRGPTTDIRTREIIRAIADELKPYRNRRRPFGEGVAMQQQWQEDEVQRWLSYHVELLREVVPQHFTRKAIKRTRADARSIIKMTKMLQGQIKNAAPELQLRWWPFLPEWFVKLNWLTKACAEADKASTDTTDRCKRLCVDEVWLLINYFSQRPATLERMGAIAGWLYEAVTGIKGAKKPKDFRYLCQQKLKRLRS